MKSCATRTALWSGPWRSPRCSWTIRASAILSEARMRSIWSRSLARSIIAESADRLQKGHISATLSNDGQCLLRAFEVHAYSILKNLIVNAVDALCEMEG